MNKGKVIIFFTLVIGLSLFIGGFLGFNLTKDNEVNIILPEEKIPTIIIEGRFFTLKKWQTIGATKAITTINLNPRVMKSENVITYNSQTSFLLSQ